MVIKKKDIPDFNKDDFKKMIHCHKCGCLSNSYNSNVNATVTLTADDDTYIEGSISVEEYRTDYCNYCNTDMDIDNFEYVFIPNNICKGLEGRKLKAGKVKVIEPSEKTTGIKYKVRVVDKKELVKILMRD